MGPLANGSIPENGLAHLSDPAAGVTAKGGRDLEYVQGIPKHTMAYHTIPYTANIAFIPEIRYMEAYIDT